MAFRKTLSLFCTLCLISSTAIFPEEPSNTGTLIVTYQTTKEGERLDRIRFWVKGNDYKQWLYPKGKSYVDDAAMKIRKVVIENLPEGKYSIEFLVPNTDGFFCEVPIRNVTVASGAVVRIDQVIRKSGDSIEEPPLATAAIPPETKPEACDREKTGSLIVSYDAGKDAALLERIRFAVIDKEGNKRIYPLDSRIINAPRSGGRLVVLSDLPLGEYTIEFFIAGLEDQARIAPHKVQIKENTTSSIYHSFASFEHDPI